MGARFSPPVQTGPGAYPASCKMGTGGKAAHPNESRKRVTDAKPNPNESSKTVTDIIIGSVITGVIILIVIALAGFLLKWNRQRNG